MEELAILAVIQFTMILSLFVCTTIVIVCMAWVVLCITSIGVFDKILERALRKNKRSIEEKV